jgi:hypothetical protein
MADHKKIKTCFAQIIVEEIAGKLYYSIMYWNGIGMHIGYSSYELENVRRWLNEEFEVNRNADVAPVVHGQWDDSGRYTFPSGNAAVRCTNCGCALTESEYHLNNWNYCPVCGAKMDGGADND